MLGRKKAAKFEIHVKKENRWSIQTAVDDGVMATARAKGYLLATGVTAVKVVKETTGFTGRTSQTTVFGAERQAVSTKSRTCYTPEAFTAPLEDANDLIAPVVRRAVGQTIKNYLVEQVISPTEFLFARQHLLRFHKDDKLPSAAFFNFAKGWQNAPEELDQKAIQARIGGLFGDAQKVAQAREQALPAPMENTGDAQAHIQGCKRLFDGHEVERMITTGVCIFLSKHRTWPSKLDQLFLIGDQTGDHAVWDLVDTITAEVLEISEMIKDLLGGHDSLADALLVLADFATGRDVPTGAGGWDGAPQLVEGIAAGRLPHIQASLILRLARAVSGDAMLTKLGARKDAEAMSRLREKLLLPNRDMVGGQAMERAFERRWDRIRTRILQE